MFGLFTDYRKKFYEELDKFEERQPLTKMNLYQMEDDFKFINENLEKLVVAFSNGIGKRQMHKADAINLAILVETIVKNYDGALIMLQRAQEGFSSMDEDAVMDVNFLKFSLAKIYVEEMVAATYKPTKVMSERFRELVNYGTMDGNKFYLKD